MWDNRACVDIKLKQDASGDLAVGDYKQALAQVRQWFKTKGGGYVILEDSY
ncbi:MAG: hypothetical protein K2U26_16690 [Cyclobacteriaceae bacterium]|nr:hypothetical protein [Cyclobacteriaceae bacterium]